MEKLRPVPAQISTVEGPAVRFLHEILIYKESSLISGRHGGYLLTDWLRLRCYGSGVSGVCPGRGSGGQ